MAGIGKPQIAGVWHYAAGAGSTPQTGILELSFEKDGNSAGPGEVFGKLKREDGSGEVGFTGTWDEVRSRVVFQYPYASPLVPPAHPPLHEFARYDVYAVLLDGKVFLVGTHEHLRLSPVSHPVPFLATYIGPIPPDIR